jgi:glyoxylase-like metal-dependent hydrolase (beta-lactamase superfamily II)
MCFYLEHAGERPLLFAGDTLFRRSIGRTDLWGGSAEAIGRSIRERLLTLPDDTVVVCGHGPETTVAAEREDNPYVGRHGRLPGEVRR